MSVSRSFARLSRCLAAVFLVLLLPAGASAQARVLTLTADSAGPLTLTLASDAYRLRLDLTQVGADSATVEVACQGMGAVTCDAGPGPQLALRAGARSALTFAVRPARPGRGLVMVRVRDPLTGARTSAALLVTVTP